MLQLREGDRFLDIGCGWGGLIKHAARNYGANALGITLSKVQAQLAEAEIHKARLSKLCRVLVKDYRELGQKEIFDKIASIGMVEHVGSEMLGEFLTRVHKALRPGGLFLLSGITLPMQRLASAASKSFVDEYVFPDGELLPVSLMAREAERAGFEIKFVRSMREHYARTLRDWVHRLEEHAEQARRLTSEVTYRTWRLYMAGSAYRFTQGALNIHQMLLAKAE
jgi:cyclopropane-fatty-acyl-phospholipid synthase